MSIRQRVSPAETREYAVVYDILEAIACAEGVDPLEIERPLYSAIDPDALDALMRHSNTDLTVEFSYLGYRIAVGTTSGVRIQPIGR